MVAAQVGQMVQGVVEGLNAQNQPSGTSITNLTFSIGDSTLATAVLDPTTPNAIDVTIVGIGTQTPGSTTITWTFTATDADGTVSTITGEDVIFASTTTGEVNPPPQRTVGSGITWSLPVAAQPPAPTPAVKRGAVVQPVKK